MLIYVLILLNILQLFAPRHLQHAARESYLQILDNCIRVLVRLRLAAEITCYCLERLLVNIVFDILWGDAIVHLALCQSLEDGTLNLVRMLCQTHMLQHHY